MTKIRFYSLFYVFFCILVLTSNVLGSGIPKVVNSNPIPEYHASEIIVKFKENISLNIEKKKNITLLNVAEIDKLNEIYNCSEIKMLFGRFNNPAKKKDNNFHRIYIFKFDSIQNIESLIVDYQNTGMFDYVEPNYTGRGGGVKSIMPNDQYLFRQWSLYNDGVFPDTHPGTIDADIDMDEAWEITTGDTSIIAAILDSGIKLDRPELTGRIWKNKREIPDNGRDDDNNGYIDDIQGWDFAYQDNVPADSFGHGSNICGIVGANGNNSIGYAGVDWSCKLMICQILNNDNWGYYTWWAEAIYYVVNHGAKVINMSVGGSSYSELLEDAVNYAYNNDTPYYPGVFANTIAVGATDTDDSRCDPFFWGGGSNYGGHIDITGPGNYIYGLADNSNTNFNYFWGGTSQAASHVTGVVSLLLAQDDTKSVNDIRNILQLTADDEVGDPSEDTKGWDQYHGYGRLNARAA